MEHNSKFERNTVTGTWRVSCTCGWFMYGTKEEVQKRAATHDLEWITADPLEATHD